MGTMATAVQGNTSIISAAALDLSSIGDMGLSTNANFNRTVTLNDICIINGFSQTTVFGNYSLGIHGIGEAFSTGTYNIAAQSIGLTASAIELLGANSIDLN